MEVAQAVMVTVDLDFGNPPPSIRLALKEIERRHVPDEGSDRTFAIIEAFGEPQADGKLRVSMRVSSERPGLGMLVFKRTGETLWKSRITPATRPPLRTGARAGQTDGPEVGLSEF